MVNLVRQYIDTDSLVIPDFINNRSVEHYNSYEMMRDSIYLSLSKCCVRRILKPDAIDDVVYEIK